MAVTLRAMQQRVNRALERNGDYVRIRCTGGRCYVYDLNLKRRIGPDMINIEYTARDLGVMRSNERVVVY